MQALVTHRPADDLAHAVHLVVAGKFSSIAKLANSDMPSVKAPNIASVRATSAHRIDAEFVHVIGLGAHLAIVAEGLELGLRHAERLQQQRIGVDMHRLHIGEGGHHHLDWCSGWKIGM